MGNIAFRYSILILAFISCLPRLYAQTPDISSIFWHLKNSFKIETYKNGKLSKTGSGYILFSKKLTTDYFEYYSISNEHVLENSDSADIILNDNRRIKIDFILVSYHKLDATLFSFKSNLDSLGYFTFPSIRKKIFKDSTLLGDNVLTISSPKGLLNSLSNGILSANREINGRNYLQFTAPISAGSSGGLVLNSKFLPIGVIVSQFSEGQNINFSIPLKIIFDSLEVSYSSKDLGLINFTKYTVNELDKHIELNFAESSSIRDQYQTNPTQAYLNIKKFKLNELTHALLWFKMDYEINNNLWDSFIASYKFYIQKYGYNILSYYQLLFMANKLNLEKSFNENIISALESTDPFNEYSTKIIADFLKGLYAYKTGNYTYSINIFTELDNLIMSEKVDTNMMVFQKYFGGIYLNKLGQMYSSQNNYKEALTAYLKVLAVQTAYNDFTQEEKQELTGNFGSKIFILYLKAGYIDEGCVYYKSNLMKIENYVSTQAKAAFQRICKN